TIRIINHHAAILEHRTETFEDVSGACETIHSLSPPSSSSSPSSSFSKSNSPLISVDSDTLRELQVSSPTPSYLE
ncbi:hypothetical protein PFISCL1PPCAC_978, partial [Pristionchus fissidentatus]